MEENEAFLLDFYKQGKLRRLLYPFHCYLKKKLEKNPNLKIKLEDPEPLKVDLSTILDVYYDPNLKINSLPAYIGHS